MTAPQQFTRRQARVEAIRIDDLNELANAQYWVEAHGLQTHINEGHFLIAWDSTAHLSVGLGQWLAFNPRNGEFTVWDEEQFRAAHSEVANDQLRAMRD